jgi:alkanesulfonate monooxygenase SsuD/methylene tetrahydromethanopterin reductase-like flavin-dependent oxidoreductase (luciferase family)
VSLPISVCLRTIRAEPTWWLESARRLDAAGYEGLWAWDHFTGQGDHTVPVVENWTILSMAAALTEHVTVGPFVLNVMNRHPAVVARMASTLQIASGGRLVLGIGIGGAPREHAAYGIDFPAAPERVARLEEAVAVIRAMWTGGPVTRESPYYPLHGASAHPVPSPPPPIIVGGETPAGARLAGRIGDGWSAFDDNFEQNLPLYLEALAATGRARATQRVLVGFQGDWLADSDIAVLRPAGIETTLFQLLLMFSRLAASEVAVFRPARWPSPRGRCAAQPSDHAACRSRRHCRRAGKRAVRHGVRYAAAWHSAAARAGSLRVCPSDPRTGSPVRDA